jgi:predicted GIY-YIG superfamily endonuclease
MARASHWFVYILECADGTLYTGCAVDVEARVVVHNLGKGAKYTRARLPVKLFYSEEALDRSSALKREYALKQLTATQKRKLVG